MSHEDPCAATEASAPVAEEAEPSGSRWRAIAALSLLLIAAVLGLLASQLSLGRVDRIGAGSLGTSSFMETVPSLVGLVAAMTMLVRRRVGDWWALAAVAGGLMTFWLADYWHGREQHHRGWVRSPRGKRC